MILVAFWLYFRNDSSLLTNFETILVTFRLYSCYFILFFLFFFFDFAVVFFDLMHYLVLFSTLPFLTPALDFFHLFYNSILNFKWTVACNLFLSVNFLMLFLICLCVSFLLHYFCCFYLFFVSVSDLLSFVHVFLEVLDGWISNFKVSSNLFRFFF